MREGRSHALETASLGWATRSTFTLRVSPLHDALDARALDADARVGCFAAVNAQSDRTRTRTRADCLSVLFLIGMFTNAQCRMLDAGLLDMDPRYQQLCAVSYCLPMSFNYQPATAPRGSGEEAASHDDGGVNRRTVAVTQCPRALLSYPVCLSICSKLLNISRPCAHTCDMNAYTQRELCSARRGYRRIREHGMDRVESKGFAFALENNDNSTRRRPRRRSAPRGSEQEAR